MNMRAGPLWLILLPVLASCSPRDTPPTPTSSGNVADTAMTPGDRAVMIGEGGPGIAACIARGRVVNLTPEGQPYLPVRAAPFVDAAETDRLQNGQRVFACSRSIDQGWRGVIIPPPDHPDADCGVTAPVAAAQPYAGPCRSGWVASAFLELSAG